ncbi:hypothetical protein DFH94DRAFT_123302 [Russula ochroleuca]|uniref:protein S-acyltransferase n=1 Tax=Russula ochroleuca TaxID=152965 RepID=A0A9P5MMP7_9AGAM|nr:hypothetical protein DFH94DRAFT_123302 [Russula ochroleuca]
MADLRRVRISSKQGSEINAVGGNFGRYAAAVGRAPPTAWWRPIDLLHQTRRNPHLLRTLRASTASTPSLILPTTGHLVYILCQPDIAVDERDHMGHTALHWAVYQRDEVSTQILLKMGADPDAADRDGLTTLHWAAVTGFKRCIIRLLEAAMTFGRARIHWRYCWNCAMDGICLGFPDERCSEADNRRPRSL